MELVLSLGETFTAAAKKAEAAVSAEDGRVFELGLAVGMNSAEEEGGGRSSVEPSPQLQLSLLPFSPVIRSSPLSCRAALALRRPSPENKNGEAAKRIFDVNRPPWLAAAEESEEPLAVAAFPSSLSQVRLSAHGARIAGDGSGGGSPAAVTLAEIAAAPPERSRGSDEDEQWAARKKLRLTREQSAFLEESFKEHNALNPKQKVALSKQLNLRPRQVEVWFQNRRARTKLKQTEVDCEYLKRCRETLTEENRRLQRELADLRALNTANPFLSRLPATTLSMCPSCERVASSVPAPPPATTNVAKPADRRPSSFAALFSKPPPFLFTTPQPTAAPPSSTSR